MQKLLVFLKKAENKCTWASHRASGLVQYSTITQHSAPTYNSNFLPMMKDIRNEETDMTVSYKKLWKLLIDKDMKKKDLEKAAGISNYVISKMNKGENITVDIVGKICSALNCTPNDIMEFSDDSI